MRSPTPTTPTAMATATAMMAARQSRSRRRKQQLHGGCIRCRRTLAEYSPCRKVRTMQLLPQPAAASEHKVTRKYVLATGESREIASASAASRCARHCIARWGVALRYLRQPTPR